MFKLVTLDRKWIWSVGFHRMNKCATCWGGLHLRFIKPVVT